MRSTKPIRTAKIGYVVMSVLLCILGVLLILFPKTSMQTICKITGGVMCIYGAVKILGYFSRDLYRLAFQFDLAYGLLILVIGVAMIAFTDKFVNVFGFVIGLLILTDALFKIQITIDSKKFGITKWWIIALLTLLTAATGVWLILSPSAFSQITMVLTGIALIYEGILNICVVILAVKISKNQKPDIIQY